MLIRWSMLLAAFFYVSAVQAEEDTPVLFKDMLKGLIGSEGSLPWMPPDYTGQEHTLGYGPGAFAVPTGMEQRVNFWIDIYTKYTTDQGLLHDSKYVHIVYEPVDFRDIMANEDLNLYQKEKARRDRMNEAKDKIRDRLKRLQRLSSSAGLEGEDLRYWYMFNEVTDKDKFVDASKDGRLRFQLGQKDRFIQGIYQSGRFVREMERIFREEKLPIELIRMVYVESSFNLKARSKVGASGIWQFMRGTGKQYLKIDAAVDERNDPILATRAAAKKLRSNYKMLESWPLAVTGYNHGPYGIRRLVNKAGTRDIAELTDVRKGSFGFASASFYASFLAAIEVEKNAGKYFGEVTMAPPLMGHEIKLDKNLDSAKLVQWFDGNVETAKEYNPHVSTNVWKNHRLLEKGHMIRVPHSKQMEVVQELIDYKVPKSVVRSSETHRVRRGETLSGIADRYRVSMRKLMDMNNISSPRSLQAGQLLEIPE